MASIFARPHICSSAFIFDTPASLRCSLVMSKQCKCSYASTALIFLSAIIQNSGSLSRGETSESSSSKSSCLCVAFKNTVNWMIENRQLLEFLFLPTSPERKKKSYLLQVTLYPFSSSPSVAAVATAGVSFSSRESDTSFKALSEWETILWTACSSSSTG